MRQRKISLAELNAAMQCAPGTPTGPGVVARQAVVNGYLIRAIVNAADDPAVVVTVYRTSKLRKYGATP